MKLLLQISLFLLTWFNLSATPAFSKVAIPNYAVSFHKTTNQNLESELKTGLNNIIKSSGKVAGRITDFNIEELKALAYTIDLKKSFLSIANQSYFKIKNNVTATLVSANIEYEIATVRYLDALNNKNLLLTAKAGTGLITNTVGYTKIGILEDVYTTENNLIKNKNISLYSKNNKIFFYLDDVVKGAGSFVNQIDNTLARLTNKAKFELLNTGEYKIVGGHHPMAKKAFEGDLVYDYKKAFSVKPSELDKAAGITNVHPSITGQQNSLYTSWKNTNPNTKITVDVMADIEIQAMKNVGIPEDVATGWVVKSLEDLKAQGVTEIKNIPWNGTN